MKRRNKRHTVAINILETDATSLLIDLALWPRGWEMVLSRIFVAQRSPGSANVDLSVEETSARMRRGESLFILGAKEAALELGRVLAGADRILSRDSATTLRHLDEISKVGGVAIEADRTVFQAGGWQSSSHSTLVTLALEEGFQLSSMFHTGPFPGWPVMRP